MSTIDVTKLVRDVQESTMQQAFYLQSKAFFEKNNEHINEIARLKAEVERLYRHGDLMLKFAAANMTFPAYATMAKDWNAAKEGKQS